MRRRNKKEENWRNGFTKFPPSFQTKNIYDKHYTDYLNFQKVVDNIIIMTGLTLSVLINDY